jgi:hypothetical protein
MLPAFSLARASVGVIPVADAVVLPGDAGPDGLLLPVVGPATQRGALRLLWSTPQGADGGGGVKQQVLLMM